MVPDTSCDIFVLTVIAAELQAVRDVFDIADRDRVKHADGTVYYRGRVRSRLSDRDCAIVIGCIGQAGNPPSASAAQAAIERVQPKVAFLVGIAAGIRGRLRIGDVVLGERVVAYEPASLLRNATDGSFAEARPEIERISHGVLQDVVAYHPDPGRIEALFAKAGGAFPTYPPGRRTEFEEHVASRPTVRISTIASGEKLLRDPTKLLAVRGIHGKTEVGEMEAFGFAESCRRSGVPWLVVRGISDFGDELKDDRFHAFAAKMAASALRDFIEYGFELPSSAPAVAGRRALDLGHDDANWRRFYPRDKADGKE